MDFILGHEDRIKTVAQLNREFHRYHKLKRSERVVPNQKACNPIVLVLNPLQYYSEFGDKWFAVYYKDFYVTIERGDSALFGPHVARLFYQICRGNTVWIGTAQLKGNFFSRKIMRKKLRIAIIAKKYYVSPKLGEDIVDIDPPDPEEFVIEAKRR